MLSSVWKIKKILCWSESPNASTVNGLVHYKPKIKEVPRKITSQLINLHNTVPINFVNGQSLTLSIMLLSFLFLRKFTASFAQIKSNSLRLLFVQEGQIEICSCAVSPLFAVSLLATGVEPPFFFGIKYVRFCPCLKLLKHSERI